MTASLTEEVLSILLEAQGAPVSGQAVAGRAGVTRAAVWKAIEGLRREGYPVESLPAKGYRLKSGLGSLREAEITASLATERFGRSLTVFETIDSTNREAARQAQAGAPEGSVVVAASQTAGRGRLGRSWFGSPGSTLMMSMVLRPGCEPREASGITYVMALALAETLALHLPEMALEIKWPNDLLVRGRKIAGILLEARIEGGALDYVVAGLGLNVTGSRAGMPPEIHTTAAILEEECSQGGCPGIVPLLADFLKEFEGRYRDFSVGGFAAVKPAFDRWFRMAGRSVTVRGSKSAHTGTVLGMDVEGALLLSTADGPITIHAGDVEWTTKGFESG